MSKIFLVAFVFTLLLSLTGTAAAMEKDAITSKMDPSAEMVERNDISLKELEYRIAINKIFLAAAREIAEESRNAEALSHIKMAESAAREGETHFKSEEYKYAIEDTYESMEMAVHAIIVAKNQHNREVRDFVIKEDLMLRDRRDTMRKESMIYKGIEEVDAFTLAAKRLLAEKFVQGAKDKLDESGRLYGSSREKYSLNDYDGSLDDINASYKLVTDAVIIIKKSQGDIITFPRPVMKTQMEQINHEIEKNDAYLYFATLILEKGDKAGLKLISEGKAKKEAARKTLSEGDIPGSIEGFKSSTELFIKAMKTVDKAAKKK